MSETNGTYNFDVNIKLDTNNNAVFSYFQNGQQVSGGGTVTERNSKGVYTLDADTLAQGFLFTGATITNLEGNCEQDFSFELKDSNRKTITIHDTDENSGTVCLVFNVECGGKPYKSADPQVKNDKEN